MEIPSFADLWHGAKTDWDLAFRAGMEKGYQIAKDILNSQTKDDEKNT